MKTLLSILATVVALSGCSTIPNVDEFSQLRHATYQLTNQEGSCSAVAIAPNLALTAAHCDGTDMRLEGKGAVKVKKNEVADLMLLFVDGLPCPCVPVAEVEPLLDTKVITVGFPMSIGEVLTEGRVGGPVGLPEESPEEVKAIYEHLYLITSPVLFGNSGGPVFARENGQWKVVGIVSRVVIVPVGYGGSIAYHLGMAIKPAVLKEFVNAKE